MPSSFLLYGSTGYSGSLIAQEAVRRGLRPLLAGRNASKVAAQANRLGLDYRVIGLEDGAALESALREVGAVLHCAGPFIHTSKPVMDACLKTGRHYLDITGEIPVFQMLAGLDAQAQERSITVLPGVGLEIVPSDCLAAHLKRRLPSATHLALAQGSKGPGGASQGTSKTVVEFSDYGGRIRCDGRLERVPNVWKVRTIDFGYGPRKAATMPWPDVITAYCSTGIPNIETYSKMSEANIRFLKIARYLSPLLRSAFVKNLLKGMVERLPEGPSQQERAATRSLAWGEVIDGQGNRAVTRLEGPEGYMLTALTALNAVQKVLEGSAPVGFQTPSLAFGADFILETEGTVREDVIEKGSF